MNNSPLRSALFYGFVVSFTALRHKLIHKRLQLCKKQTLLAHLQMYIQYVLLIVSMILTNKQDIYGLVTPGYTTV